jgi:hypothetical protein
MSSFPTSVVTSVPAAIFSDLSRWHRWPRRCRAQAHDVVHLSLPWACNTVVLPKPATPSTAWCPWARGAVDSIPSPSLRCHWARNATLYIFYVIMGLQIMNLICYIATLLWYAALLWYDTHHFCSAALLWYATLPHCYIAFVVLHCLKYSYIATLLKYATHCTLECGYVSSHSRLKSL